MATARADAPLEKIRMWALYHIPSSTYLPTRVANKYGLVSRWCPWEEEPRYSGPRLCNSRSGVRQTASLWLRGEMYKNKDKTWVTVPDARRRKEDLLFVRVELTPFHQELYNIERRRDK